MKKLQWTSVLRSVWRPPLEPISRHAKGEERLMPGNEKRHPRRVVLHGLPYFCAKLQEVLREDGWDVRFQGDHSLWGLLKLIANLARCDLAFTWGGRVSLGMF